MRVLIPDHVESGRLDEVRAVSDRVEVAVLHIERPPWARALRFVSSRWLPWRVHRAVRGALGGSERLSVGTPAGALRDARGVEALLATWELGARSLRRVVDALPDLRWVHSTSTGLDRFDLDQLRARGIALTGPRGVHARRVAEFVMALVYADAKRLGEHGRSPPRVLRSAELPDLTLGVIGYGAVGQAVARLARANGMQVRAWVRDPSRAARVEGVGVSTELRGVLAGSDVVVLALPLTPATRGLVDRPALASLRPTALLVNVGRAATIAEDDLIRALRGGRLRRACLDLVDDEDDAPRTHPLLRAPNVLYTAHSAAASPAADGEVFAGFVANLRRYCEGRPLEGAGGLAGPVASARDRRTAG